MQGTPMIFITFNYRVGPLGYPQGTEAIQEGALNLGIKDYEAVLQWVQVNIAAFGGSPEKVTISGASAGSINLSALMLNPNFKLARAAVSIKVVNQTPSKQLTILSLSMVWY